VGNARALECYGFHWVSTPFTTLFGFFISIISTANGRVAQACKVTPLSLLLLPDRGALSVDRNAAKFSAQCACAVWFGVV
jgi:hypothetical protein